MERQPFPEVKLFSPVIERACNMANFIIERLSGADWPVVPAGGAGEMLDEALYGQGVLFDDSQW